MCQCIVCCILLELSMPINIVLDERMVKLVTSCLNSNEVISLCTRIRLIDNSFLYIFYKYIAHCELSGYRVSHNFTSYLYNRLKENGKK